MDDLPIRFLARGALLVAAAALSGAILPAVCVAAGPRPAPYGSKVVFREGSPLSFADFELTFLGTRRVTRPEYPRGFVYFDFRVSRGEASTAVSWSAGTGDVGPAPFDFAGKRFRLELKRSDRAGALRDDELVVTPAPEAP